MTNNKKKSFKQKKIVAWGASPIFSLYLQHCPKNPIAYCVDNSKKKQGKTIQGVPIVSPKRLKSEKRDDLFVINFGHSSSALQSINKALSDYGMRLGSDYVDFAEYAKMKFKKRAQKCLNTSFLDGNYSYARAFNLNSVISLETTVLGNWLLLEALAKTEQLSGAIAEIGAFEGGNSYLLSSAMELRNDKRNFYVIDSFEGFSEMSANDPKHLQDAYADDYRVNMIFNSLSIFKRTKVIKGFVPQVFKKLKSKEKYSVVFFDCDLYQPALDTYHYFWDKLQKGGIFVIHDNIANQGEWTGVRQASHEFFDARGIKFDDLWQTTMSVIVK